MPSSDYSFQDYANDLMKSAIGIVGISLADFLLCEPREILLVIEGYEERKEQDFHFMQVALVNAIGMALSKKFKPIDPFKKDNGQGTITAEKKEEVLNFLKDKLDKEEEDM